MAIKVAINGFGRIGRLVARAILERDDHDLDLVSINDLADTNANALLFQYDSTHGRFPGTYQLPSISRASAHIASTVGVGLLPDDLCQLTHVLQDRPGTRRQLLLCPPRSPAAGHRQSAPPPNRHGRWMRLA